MVTKLAFCRFGSNFVASLYFLTQSNSSTHCGHSAAPSDDTFRLRIVLEPGDFEAPDANILEVVIFVGVSLVSQRGLMRRLVSTERGGVGAGEVTLRVGPAWVLRRRNGVWLYMRVPRLCSYTS
jgi:hypothetical protein